MLINQLIISAAQLQTHNNKAVHFLKGKVPDLGFSSHMSVAIRKNKK
jgi:hypothetical protein